MIRENNKKLNETILYFYDDNGNIQKKEFYNFTTVKDLSKLTPKNVVHYEYADKKCTDK